MFKPDNSRKNNMLQILPQVLIYLMSVNDKEDW